MTEIDLKRWSKLAGIKTEGVDDLDLSSAFDGLVDDIENELEDIPTNEIVITSALILSIPGIIKAVAKCVKIITQKAAKFQISKNNEPTYQSTPKLDYIINVSKQIDEYLDAPFNLILKPFIQDDTKRKETANILKIIALVALGAYEQIDVSKVSEVSNVIKKLSPAGVGIDLGVDAATKVAPWATQILKDWFTKLSV